MKNYPRLLCLHVSSDLKRKEFICLLHSNSACTMRLENGETPSRIREYSCRIVVITNEDGSLPGIVPVSSVMVPSKGWMEASIYPEKLLKVTFLVDNYLIRWR